MNTIQRLIIALVCVTPLTAFTPLSPNRHVVSNGEFFVVFDPNKEPDLATAFQVTEGGFKQLWQSKGWFGYDNEIFLSTDGMSLVRIERITNDLNGKKIIDESVLFFYYKGILVKEYKLSELVTDMSSLEDIGRFGGFGSLWMDKAEIVQSDGHDINTDRKDEKPDEQTLRSYNHFTFRMKTLEKSDLFFDLLDGKRIVRRETEVVEAEEKSEETGDPFAEEQIHPNDNGTVPVKFRWTILDCIEFQWDDKDKEKLPKAIKIKNPFLETLSFDTELHSSPCAQFEIEYYDTHFKEWRRFVGLPGSGSWPTIDIKSGKHAILLINKEYWNIINETLQSFKLQDPVRIRVACDYESTSLQSPEFNWDRTKKKVVASQIIKPEADPFATDTKPTEK